MGEGKWLEGKPLPTKSPKAAEHKGVRTPAMMQVTEKRVDCNPEARNQEGGEGNQRSITQKPTDGRDCRSQLRHAGISLSHCVPRTQESLPQRSRSRA